MTVPISGLAFLALLLASGCSRVSEVLTLDPIDASDETANPEGGSVASSTIDAGDTHSCATLRGALYCWGANDSGQLGLGDQLGRELPARVGSLSDWEEVTTGAHHSCARRSDGSDLCFGADEIGQLGAGVGADSLEPTPVLLPSPSTRLVTESNHACALLRDGALWCWGENLEGELGQGDAPPFSSQLAAIRVGADQDWIAVDTGQGDTCGLRGMGDLFCWGRNSASQLGLGDGAPRQIRVATRSDEATYRRIQTGQDSTCGIRTDGTLHCWGANVFANLGTGDRSAHSSAVQIGDKQDWAELSLDTFHSCAIDLAQHLFCWGRNAEGQLGTGDTDDRLSPTQVSGEGFVTIAVGRFHTCALKADDSVWCSGANESGELGVGDTERRNTFTALVFPQK